MSAAPWITPALVAAAFVVGSIPFGLLLARLRGVDIRKVGSGNIGTTNVLRSQGKGMAALTLLCDLLKGLVPTWAALAIAGPPAAAPTAVAAVAGHCFSIFLRGKGGKGVATGLGVFLVLSPKATLAALAIFIATVATTRYVSLGSLLAAAAVAPLAWLLGSPGSAVVAALAVALIIVARHHENVRRLVKGRESKLGGKNSRVVKPAPEESA